MNTILTTAYIILLFFALIYAGINIYHILKYRFQLPVKDAKGAIMVMWVYIIASGAILSLSAIVALFYIFLT